MDGLLAILSALVLGFFVLFLCGLVSAWWTTRHAPRHYSELYLAHERQELERQAREDEEKGGTIPA